ncbi:MAG: FG-GAP repeat protein [Deltaproteobacteria bacterium]|nr:FG-GAP repeat protein [Deltaproteobacteria bacterium]
MTHRFHVSTAIVAVLGGLVLSSGGCTGTGGSDRVCDPGAVQHCACPTGPEGVQTCTDDGSRWGTCECGGSDADADGDGDDADIAGDADSDPDDTTDAADAEADTDDAAGADADSDDAAAVDDADPDGAPDVGSDDAGDVPVEADGHEAGPLCGNGSVDLGEDCDDSNDVPADGCEEDCTYSCVGDGDCDDSNDCTSEYCFAGGTGQLCARTTRTGEACEDGSPCTGPDLCDASAVCVSGPASPPPVPAPLVPWNGALTGSSRAPDTFGARRPRFRWTWASDGLCAPAFEIQVDDTCTTPGFAICAFPSPEASASGLTDASWTPAAGLPISTARPVGRRYYWRVRACRGATCSAWSAVRYLDVARVYGDFNGDGYSDAVVGAFFQDGTAADEGTTFVYDGGAAGLPTLPTLTLNNPAHQAGARFGVSVAVAGDLNADGFADLVVGASRYDSGSTDEGNVFIFHGGATGLSSAPATILDNPTGQSSSYFGNDVAGAGDVNADGYADVVVGASRCTAGTTYEGNAFVYLGSSTGLPTAPATTIDNPGGEDYGYFGGSVASAADVNGDGYADIAIGESNAHGVGVEEGAAFVFHGSASGTPNTPTSTLWGPTHQANSDFGVGLGPAGDVNADGWADVVVGAPSLDVSGASDQGAAYVFLGGPSGMPASPSVSLANPGGSWSGAFGTALAASGDLEADGFADVVVGAERQFISTGGEGAAFVFPGSASGVSATSTLRLDDAPGEESSYFGSAMAVAGDLNGDGYADLLIGAFWQDNGATDEGNVYVYVGSSSGIPAVATQVLDNPANQTNAYFGRAVD